jgi:uncharacterized membrane protein HdeD (DUF308 family)
MAGMLQIITYLLCFYLVVKGIVVLQIALASGRENRRPMIILGAVTLVACIAAAFAFGQMQDRQATAMSSSGPSMPSY